MPLFKRKHSEAGRNRMEHQQYLARESRESTFDLSECELNEIPSGTFSLCKVLQKEALLLHGNFLSHLRQAAKTTTHQNGGSLHKSSFSDLEALRVLDLHNNEITELPPDIGILKCLQVLNLEKNKLTKLPVAISRLTHLQTLNLRNNKLKFIAKDCFDGMRSLRSLDVSCNPLSSLPKEICKVRSLESLHLTAEKMSYPSAEISAKGTVAIMMFLCSECGETYEPPSKFTLDILEPPKVSQVSMRSPQSSSSDACDKTDSDIMAYEKIRERKRLQRLEIEKRLAEDKEAHAELNLRAKEQKLGALQDLAKDERRMLGDLARLQCQKAMEHRHLVDNLAEVEASAQWLVDQLLRMNESARRLEASLEEEEIALARKEEWFRIRAEEAAYLRRQEVLNAMKHILIDSDRQQHALQQQSADRLKTQAEALKQVSERDSAVNSALQARNKDQQHLVSELIRDDEWQKRAFNELQLQKDTKTQRIVRQIELIENELSCLTVVELDKRKDRNENELRMLAEKRSALIDLLQQLLKERAKREKELTNRLSEMEEQRRSDEIDYWLVQYQRLLDRKPQQLMDEHHQLEKAVIQILDKANANDFLPVFQRHRITIETLYQISEEDLKSMGVHALGTRRAILKAIDDYKLSKKGKEKPTTEKKTAELQPDWQRAPSQPPAAVSPESVEVEMELALTPTAPPMEVVARQEVQCCICLDRESSIVFLNCGHVCCCMTCANPLTQCPLCRSTVVGRVCLPNAAVATGR